MDEDTKSADGAGSIAEQRELLLTLRALEQSIRATRERERDLEVECIAAEVAVRAGRSGKRPQVETTLAAEIVDLLDRQRGLEARVEEARESSGEEHDSLRAGCEALRSWLETSGSQRPDRAAGTVRAVLLIASLIALWAAFAVHLVFLVLLVPVAGAASFLTWSGQDTQWKRMGTKQRFEATGLTPPAKWEEESVRLRLGEIEALIEKRSASKEGPTADDPRALTAEIDLHHAELATLLAGAGLEVADLDRRLEGWLRQVSSARKARVMLEEVKSNLAANTTEENEARERLFRYLARHGETPPGGHADTEALAAGLERVASR